MPIQILMLAGLMVRGWRLSLPDAFMAAKYFFRPGKRGTLLSDGYGNELASTAPLVTLSFSRSASSENVGVRPLNRNSAFSCAIAATN